MKLFDSELQVMEVLWEKGDLCAREVARILADKIGWNKNTTYTIIHKLIGKGAIERLDPGFICPSPSAKGSRHSADAARQLIDRFFTWRRQRPVRLSFCRMVPLTPGNWLRSGSWSKHRITANDRAGLSALAFCVYAISGRAAQSVDAKGPICLAFMDLAFTLRALPCSASQPKPLPTCF